MQETEAQQFPGSKKTKIFCQCLVVIYAEKMSQRGFENVFGVNKEKGQLSVDQSTRKLLRINCRSYSVGEITT